MAKEKEKPKDRHNKLMTDVEKTNPDFVKWLRERSGGKGKDNSK